VSEGKQAIAQTDELAIRADYEARRPLLDELANNIRSVCEQLLETQKIPLHSVEVRVKSISSVLEKISQISRKGCAPSLDELDDIVGLRVICLYPKHVDLIVDLMEREFKVLTRLDKRSEPSPEHFGYSSVHLVCTLSDTQRENLPKYSRVGLTHFEVQVSKECPWAACSG
jgi:putative GTP pyrophosphokinase